VAVVEMTQMGQKLISIIDGHYKDAIHKHPRQLPAFPPREDPAPETTYALLAQELNKLSMTERDTIFADVHGVAPCIEESPEFVQNSLEELDDEVDKISQKPAYARAKRQSPTYVADSNFRLKFLRAHRFEAKDAAAAMASFFEIKLDLFGFEKLTREIVLEDFDEDDLELLGRGGFQLLPGRDNSGRVVISNWPLVLNQGDVPLRSKVNRVRVWILSAFLCGCLLTCQSLQ
jgi:hypothetical protein